MVTFFKHSLLLGAFLFASGSALGQQSHDGYTRPYKEMEKELNPTTLSEEALIKLLDDTRFYAREVSSRELIKRETKHSIAVIVCMKTGSAEAKHRAEEIMKAVAFDLLEKQKNQFSPTLTVKPKSPRFWSGTNQWIGGAFDKSLDSDIELCSDRKLQRVTTPLTVISAKSDSGETLGGQIWKQNNCAEGSASLFLNHPNGHFNFVTAEVIVKGSFEAGELVALPMKNGKTVIRDGLCWVSIHKEIDKESNKEYCLVFVTDLLGRLNKAETIQLLKDDNSLLQIELTTNDCAFQRFWRFPVNEDSRKITKLKLKIGGPLLPFEQKLKVTVQNPTGIKS